MKAVEREALRTMMQSKAIAQRTQSLPIHEIPQFDSVPLIEHEVSILERRL